jgi:hypothetical protein
MCCCSHDEPHDETLKFLLKGEDDALDTPIIIDREEGDAIIEDDVN